MAESQLCKVCSVKRQPCYGLAVTSLDHLRVKGREALGFSPDTKVSVVLEDDGTFVEDETYFLCLPPNTKFMLLREMEMWIPGNTIDGGIACLTSESTSLNTDTVDSSESWHLAANQLKQNLSSIILMSEGELQNLVDAPVKDLASVLDVPEQKASDIQNALQEVLDRREEERQSKELLQLYVQVMGKENQSVSQPAIIEGENVMDEVDWAGGTQAGLSSRTLQVLKHKTQPETRLSNAELQMVLNEGAELMRDMLGWDVMRTALLMKACEEEQNKRLQQVQAMHCLSSISLSSKLTHPD